MMWVGYAWTGVPLMSDSHWFPLLLHTTTPLPAPAGSPGFRPFDAYAKAPGEEDGKDVTEY